MKAKTQTLPDAHIHRGVIRQLEWEPEVSSTDIGTSVTDGVVTLSGQVDTYAEKMAAERTVKRVQGVKALANELQVRPVGVRTDTEIASDVLRALNAHVSVPSSSIKATVREGWVTLEGIVDRIFQKEAAQGAVAFLGGVRGIANEITVKPKASPPGVKQLIQEALRRNAEVEADRIKVDAENGVVTLSGVVNSWVEKEEAERAAQGAPGVSKVESHILVGAELLFWE